MAEPSLPDACLQVLIDGSWWVPTADPTPRFGLLVESFVRFCTSESHALVVERAKAKDHDRFMATLKRPDVNAKGPLSTLPVAALPKHNGETYFVQLGKRRPALIIGGPGRPTPPSHRTRNAGWRSKCAVVLAPYYGAWSTPDGKKKGWNPKYIEAVQRLVYPQKSWDLLPAPSMKPAILRFDHLQSVPPVARVLRPLGFELSNEAKALIRRHLDWYLSGTEVPSDEYLHECREALLEDWVYG